MKIHLATAVKMWPYDLGEKKNAKSYPVALHCERNTIRAHFINHTYQELASPLGSLHPPLPHESLLGSHMHVGWYIHGIYIFTKWIAFVLKKYELPLFFFDHCLHQGPVKEWKIYQSLNRQDLNIRNFQLVIKLRTKQLKVFPGGTIGAKYPPANAGDLRDVGSICGSGRYPGEGKGNPLQYSCLENPMDRGAWWATVQRVGHDWSDLAYTQVTEKEKANTTEELMLLNCGVGEDSWESLGLQGDQFSQS